jgi:hypothetical protein
LSTIAIILIAVGAAACVATLIAFVIFRKMRSKRHSQAGNHQTILVVPSAAAVQAYGRDGTVKAEMFYATDGTHHPIPTTGLKRPIGFHLPGEIP